MKLGKRIMMPKIGPRGATQSYGSIVIIDESSRPTSIILKVDACYPEKWGLNHERLFDEFVNILKENIRTAGEE